MARRVILGDLSQQEQQVACLELLEVYMRSSMGCAHYLTPALSEQIIQGLKELSTTRVFFAKDQAEYLGMAICFVGFSSFEGKGLINIHDLIVHRDFRRQGIARELIEAIADYANAQNFCRLTLEVREDNIKALKLYQKMGFTDGPDPMVFMRKTL